MNRRHAHTLASPALTGGDDRPETPCAGRWDIYDVLIEEHRGPVLTYAVQQARRICGTCPLMAACLSANRDEPWVAALIDGQEVAA